MALDVTMSISRARETSEAVPTPRQLEVLAHIEQRLTIKEIANRLRVSESAVNKHIRTLKMLAGVNSQRELAAYFHRFSDPSGPEPMYLEEATGGCSETAWRKNELFGAGLDPPAHSSSAEPSVATMQDSQGFAFTGPWSFDKEVAVAPRVLNGHNATWVRGAALTVMVIGVFVAVIVGLGAAQAISLALEARTTVSRPG